MTYDQPNARGSILSTNTTEVVNVKPTRTNISIVLDGVVQKVALLLAKTNPPVGTSATIGLSAILQDTDGNLIVGPAPYFHPVTLTSTDPIKASLSKTTLYSPADAAGITVRYSGAGAASVMYSATATGLQAANVVAAVLSPGATNGPEHLYVAKLTANAPGSVLVLNLAQPTAVPATLSGPSVAAVEGVAVDASDRLYVLNSNPSPPSVGVFDLAQGNAVLPTIPLPQSPDFNGGLTIDSSGKLYVATDGTIEIVDTANENAMSTIAPNIGLDGAITLDAGGKLYVGESLASNNAESIGVFDTAHANAPLPSITGHFDAVRGIAVNAAGILYAANSRESDLSGFDTLHGNVELPRITGGGLDKPTYLAIDAAGKLYALNGGRTTVSVFDTAHNNLPLSVITLPSAGIGSGVGGIPE